MENQEVIGEDFFPGARVSKGRVTSCGDGSKHQSSGFMESDNLGDHLFEGLDSYLDDVNDRLTISRMVSESVIRGMVNAVQQEAAEKITAKELELARFKEALHFNQVGRDETEISGSPVKQNQSRNAEFGLPCSLSNASVDHGKMREALGNLRSLAGQQIKKLKKEIYGIRGGNSIRRIASASEASESWDGVDTTLDALKATLDTISTQVDDMLALTSVCEWQQEQEFQRELEAMVIKSCIRSLQEELAPLSNNAEILDSLMVHLNNLLLENQQLRDSLIDTKKKVKYLSRQVSDAAAKMLHHSSTQMELLKLIENLKSNIEDAHIEALGFVYL